MRPHARLGLFATALAGALACTKVSTDASAPVAIELRPPPLPSVLVGDVMRDSLGDTARLQAVVFNAKTDTIPDAPVTFLALDTTGKITVDQATGIVFGRDTGNAAVVAVISGLQSPLDTITVVDTPTTFLPVDVPPETLRVSFTGRDTLQPLRVRLLHISGTDTVPVRRWAVRYTFLHPAGFDNADSLKPQLVNAARRPALLDTTDATGSTSRSLRIAALAQAFADSVVVEATPVGPPGTPVAGQTIRFALYVVIQ
ncbi:MAG TPA: hypothetical protein VFS44_00215 [Gemmatimonadaceae bacterium]|nr:hypothetical protein [Gemmatimonadaceae bacterium]